ncbi:hypothetical protein cyc_09176 [Cyclospora cayetanensis]|uniref:Uncharacterized protein n=1 Tax=Cyclospora cayetanensis TaxID=88456 RepID=A0A1D3D494_9EIME|nr:hypothetical protein cyc_09176 [Cyclospora cayetanensis]
MFKYGMGDPMERTMQPQLRVAEDSISGGARERHFLVSSTTLTSFVVSEVESISQQGYGFFIGLNGLSGGLGRVHSRSLFPSLVCNKKLLSVWGLGCRAEAVSDLSSQDRREQLTSAREGIDQCGGGRSTGSGRGAGL